MTHPSKQDQMREIRVDLIDYFDVWFVHAEGLLNRTNVLNRADFLATIELIGETYMELGENLKSIQLSLTKPDANPNQLTLVKDNNDD